MWRNVAQCDDKSKKFLHQIAAHFGTFNHKMVFFKICQKLVDSGAMWRIVAYLNEPQFATLGHI